LRIERGLHEFKKTLRHSRFLQSRQMPMAVVAALFALVREHVVASPTAALRALSHCRVNTSLSGTLFF
jgi:hypothetical protein